jgi:hypothetical protein
LFNTGLQILILEEIMRKQMIQLGLLALVWLVTACQGVDPSIS